MVKFADFYCSIIMSVLFMKKKDRYYSVNIKFHTISNLANKT